MEDVLGFIAVFSAMFLSWLVSHLLCEFKHLWCKKECDKCGCWTCKFYPESEVKKCLEKD